MNFSKKIAVTVIALSSVITVNSVQAASSLGFEFNADDRFDVYLSTDNTVQGTNIYSDSLDTSNNWTGFNTGNTNLTDGQDYFLHVYAVNGNGPAGFIGDVTLTDLSSHIFAAIAGDTVTTNILAAWSVSDTGWGNYGAVTAVSGWSGITNADGTVQGGNATATQWIWDADNADGDDAYFSVAIKANTAAAVPEPGVTLLLASGLLAFAGMRKKQ